MISKGGGGNGNGAAVVRSLEDIDKAVKGSGMDLSGNIPDFAGIPEGPADVVEFVLKVEKEAVKRQAKAEEVGRIKASHTMVVKRLLGLNLAPKDTALLETSKKALSMIHSYLNGLDVRFLRHVDIVCLTETVRLAGNEAVITRKMPLRSPNSYLMEAVRLNSLKTYRELLKSPKAIVYDGKGYELKEESSASETLFAELRKLCVIVKGFKEKPSVETPVVASSGAEEVAKEGTEGFEVEVLIEESVITANGSGSGEAGGASEPVADGPRSIALAVS